MVKNQSYLICVLCVMLSHISVHAQSDALKVSGGFGFGFGLSSIPKFIKSAENVPASIRYLPTIETEPHLVEWPSVRTRNTMLFTMRAAPWIRIGPISLEAGIEQPVNFENILIDEEYVCSWENWNAWYEACFREKTRFFIDLAYHPEKSITTGLGWMVSRLRYEFRSGNESSNYIPSVLMFIPEHFVSHEVYRYYPVAEEWYHRFYAFVQVNEGWMGATMNLSFGKNPFKDNTYYWENEPLTLLTGHSYAATLSLSIICLIGGRND